MATVPVPGTTSAAHAAAEALGSFRAQTGLDNLVYSGIDSGDDAALLVAVATRYNDTRTTLDTRFSATLGSAIADPANTTVAAVQADLAALAAAVTNYLP